MDSFLEDPKAFIPLLGVLLKALGGKFRIAQDDLNDVAGTILVEELNPNAGTLTFRLTSREPQQ